LLAATLKPKCPECSKLGVEMVETPTKWICPRCNYTILKTSMGGRNLATKQYSTGSNPKKESPIFYEARLWRKWANMYDVIRPFASEKEAYDYLTHLRYIAKAGDKITIKRSQDWDVKVLHREVIEEDGQYWATRKPFEPIPTEPLDSVQYSTTALPRQNTPVTPEVTTDEALRRFEAIRKAEQAKIRYGIDITKATEAEYVKAGLAQYRKEAKELGFSLGIKKQTQFLKEEYGKVAIPTFTGSKKVLQY